MSGPQGAHAFIVRQTVSKRPSFGFQHIEHNACKRYTVLSWTCHTRQIILRHCTGLPWWQPSAALPDQWLRVLMPASHSRPWLSHGAVSKKQRCNSCSHWASKASQIACISWPNRRDAHVARKLWAKQAGLGATSVSHHSAVCMTRATVHRVHQLSWHASTYTQGTARPPKPAQWD